MSYIIHLLKYVRYYKTRWTFERTYDALKMIKEQKKKIDDEIKAKEEELFQYCGQHGIDVETATEGKYNIKPLSGRRLKQN